jgi:hypothetical protein
MPKNLGTRPKRLTEKNIAQILHTLDSWRGPLTWDLLLDAIEVLLKHRYSRQALWMHERIRLAFGVRKSLSAGPEKMQPRGSLGIIAAHEQIANLRAKVARLEDENQKLKVQFIRWAHNAHKRGLDETFLNQPLPAIDREASKVGMMRKGGNRP